MSAIRSSILRNARPAAFKPATRLNAFTPKGRFYSTEPAAKSSSLPLYLGGAAVLAAGGYYFTTSNSDTARGAQTVAKGAAAKVDDKVGARKGLEDYQKVYNRIVEVMEDAEGYDDGSYGPVLVRLAWHASGTYDKESNTGGSNYATMRFEPEALHGANNGLNVARDVMQKIKDEFPWISYGDLWILGGVAAIQEMSGGGCLVPFKSGRIDGFDKDVTPDGRLPDATQGSDHLRNIFYRMGFNDQEIVALSGAHALGRCHTDRSGFDGPWTFSPTTLSNSYYELLMSEKWSWRKWNGPKQLTDGKTKSLMMLPTDMVLIKDKSFKKTVEVYAKDEQKFFEDFSKVVSKLFELGVPESQFGETWTLKPTV